VFTDLSTGGPTSWLWTFGDGSTSTVKSPSHSYAAGVYDVSLRATNASGSNTLSRSAFIQASAAVAPTADFSGTPLAGVAPLAVTFTDLSAGNPTAWSWSFGDGGTSTARNPSHTYMAAGSYSVSLTASNALGPSTKLRSAYVIASTGLPVTTFGSVADAKVSQAAPTTSYGNEADLRLRTSTASWRSFVRFSVAGIAKPVARATLRLWVTDSSSDLASLYGVANTWSEGVTWTTAPEIAGTPIASFGSPTAGVWVEVDVTARVTGNGSYDFGLVNADTDSAIYSSREGVHPPQLVVETLP
jgi:PKD repeat protein